MWRSPNGLARLLLFSPVCGFSTTAVRRGTYACEMKPRPCGATTVPAWRAVRVGNFVAADSRLEAFRLGGSGTRSRAVRSPKHEVAPQPVSGRISSGLLSSCNKTSASGSRTHQCLESRRRARCETGTPGSPEVGGRADAVIAGMQEALEQQTQARASGRRWIDARRGPRVAYKQRRGRPTVTRRTDIEWTVDFYRTRRAA